MINPLHGNLFIVTAASGAGKTSLVKAILKNNPNLELSISFTTRTPRPGEVDGVDYRFINKKSFNEMQQQGIFLETAECHGAFYGTSKETILEAIKLGKDIILEIDWQGAFSVKKIYQDAISIFILPPSIKALEERLKKRGQDSKETISKRLSAAKDEMSHLEKFDYVTINDDFDCALKELEAIIMSKTLKTHKQLHRHHALINELRK
ncbi:MAG: guanylate kinase [Methylophilaceae bacterium]|jgi:guanylate kinase|nr:guanylate kinase [Methylophilaceae bacterium]